MLYKIVTILEALKSILIKQKQRKKKEKKNFLDKQKNKDHVSYPSSHAYLICRCRFGKPRSPIQREKARNFFKSQSLPIYKGRASNFAQSLSMYSIQEKSSKFLQDLELIERRNLEIFPSLTTYIQDKSSQFSKSHDQCIGEEQLANFPSPTAFIYIGEGQGFLYVSKRIYMREELGIFSSPIACIYRAFHLFTFLITNYH